MHVLEGPAIPALYQQLVADFGGVEAAAALLKCGKGTISKECNGHSAIPAIHIWKLERALRRRPISDMVDDAWNREIGTSSHLDKLISNAATEIEDVPGALVNLMNKGDRAMTLKEIQEAISALSALADGLSTEEAGK